jgi:hypothetical protein
MEAIAAHIIIMEIAIITMEMKVAVATNTGTISSTTMITLTTIQLLQ